MSWYQSLVLVVAGLVTIITFVRLALWPVIREVRELMTWWRKFQRDWDGTPEEAGRAAVPGVMARLNAIDGELQRNGGESVKDKVNQTHRMVSTLFDRVEVIEDRQCVIQREVEAMRG
jgi:hypothetical protein